MQVISQYRKDQHSLNQDSGNKIPGNYKPVNRGIFSIHLRIITGMLAMIFIFTRCIDPFVPEIAETEDLMVINGRITDQEGYQYIEVSRTSPVYSNTGAEPVRFCLVQVEDSRGVLYDYVEILDGKYACLMEQADLVAGREYRLTVTTPDGSVYISTFEKLLPCPEIEEIPWEIKGTQTSDPNISYSGVQFFISTDATGDYAKNYLWELQETWKYHVKYWIQDLYDSLRRFDGDPGVGIIIHDSTEPVDTLNTCYRTVNIPQVYTYSTRNISGDHIRNIPLNYVSDQSERLSVRYSLRARQYSLTDEAYEFWKTLDGQSKESGELYGTHPVRIQGNIISVDDPEETVLGLFHASAIKEKRIFMWPNIHTSQSYCSRTGSEREELLEFLGIIHPVEYPIYLVRYRDTLVDYAEQHCFDCRLKGGKLEQPSFWED